jgi:hypothetical protein
MKLLSFTTDYNETIKIAQELNSNYNKMVTYHCYWNGKLNDKHLYSIKSCYYFNVHKKNNKIILWLENNTKNEYNELIEKYAEIRYFNLENEMKGTFLENQKFYYNQELSFYSDVVRYILLYKYSGCWFDLDILFLRSFEPLYSIFENMICVYQWENQHYPNGAIYISLTPYSNTMKDIIQFIIQRNRGWGFQEAYLTYDLPLDMLVLPCSWFDGGWINNPYNISWDNLFKSTNIIYTFDTFFPGAFCYHWHNRWNHTIEDNSIMKQLIKIIDNNI